MMYWEIVNPNNKVGPKTCGQKDKIREGPIYLGVQCKGCYK